MITRETANVRELFSHPHLPVPRVTYFNGTYYQRERFIMRCGHVTTNMLICQGTHLDSFAGIVTRTHQS